MARVTRPTFSRFLSTRNFGDKKNEEGNQDFALNPKVIGFRISGKAHLNRENDEIGLGPIVAASSSAGMREDVGMRDGCSMSFHDKHRRLSVGQSQSRLVSLYATD